MVHFSGLDKRLRLIARNACSVTTSGDTLLSMGDSISEASAKKRFDEGLSALNSGDLLGATKLFVSAAQAGSADAMIQLGELEYEKGNIDDAKQWWQKAATEDLYELSSFGWYIEEIDRQDRLIILQIAAEAGDSQSKLALGIEAEDRGDFEEAKRFYLAASPAAEEEDGGDIRAEWQLGLIALAEKDLVSAKKYFEDVAFDWDAHDQENAKIILAFIAQEQGNMEEKERLLADWEELAAWDEDQDLIERTQEYSLELATFCLEFAFEQGILDDEDLETAKEEYFG